MGEPLRPHRTALGQHGSNDLFIWEERCVSSVGKSAKVRGCEAARAWVSGRKCADVGAQVQRSEWVSALMHGRRCATVGAQVQRS